MPGVDFWFLLAGAALAVLGGFLGTIFEHWYQEQCLDKGARGLVADVLGIFASQLFPELKKFHKKAGFVVLSAVHRMKAELERLDVLPWSGIYLKRTRDDAWRASQDLIHELRSAVGVLGLARNEQIDLFIGKRDVDDFGRPKEEALSNLKTELAAKIDELGELCTRAEAIREQLIG